MNPPVPFTQFTRASYVGGRSRWSLPQRSNASLLHPSGCGRCSSEGGDVMARSGRERCLLTDRHRSPMAPIGPSPKTAASLICRWPEMRPYPSGRFLRSRPRSPSCSFPALMPEHAERAASRPGSEINPFDQADRILSPRSCGSSGRSCGIDGIAPSCSMPGVPAWFHGMRCDTARNMRQGPVQEN